MYLNFVLVKFGLLFRGSCFVKIDVYIHARTKGDVFVLVKIGITYYIGTF